MSSFLIKEGVKSDCGKGGEHTKDVPQGPGVTFSFESDIN